MNGRICFLAPALVMLAVAAMGGIGENPLPREAPPIDLSLTEGQWEIRPLFNTCGYYFVPGKTSALPGGQVVEYRKKGSSQWTSALPPGADGQPAAAKGSVLDLGEAAEYQLRTRDLEWLVEYREKGSSHWMLAFPPVMDKPLKVWKGSVFNLKEATNYQLRVRESGAQTPEFEGEFATLSPTVKIARTVSVDKMPPNGTLRISDKGQLDGWIKYTASPGWTLSCDDELSPAVLFEEAQYVLLEGLRIRGGGPHCVNVRNSQNIRIVNCEISGWGRAGKQSLPGGSYVDKVGKWGIFMDAAVAIAYSSNVLVERCYIHDQRGRSHSWMFSHPGGPVGICPIWARGGVVIRYNDIVGSDERRWNDIITSNDNQADTGGLYRDSDVYGNFLAFANDDGIEMEGGGMNVRFFQNKMEGAFCGVSTGACRLGPMYIFDNLLANLEDEGGLGGVALKRGSGAPQTGRRFFISNTVFAPAVRDYDEACGNPVGLNALLTFSRNNIFCVGNGSDLKVDAPENDDFNNNLFWTQDDPSVARDALGRHHSLSKEADSFVADPRFVNSAAGDFRLADGSPARRKGEIISDIDPAVNGEKPDLGAFQGMKLNQVPFRPIPLEVTPEQINFKSGETNASKELVAALPAQAASACRFKIRQNQVSDWFKVEPSEGEIKPGSQLKLKVSLVPEKLKGRSLFRGAFLVRMDDGFSRPVTVYAACEFKEPWATGEYKGAIVLEAENAEGVTKDMLRQDPKSGASSGKYLSLSASSAPVLNYNFKVEKKGTYYLLLRMRPHSPMWGKCAFDVRIDGGKPEEFAMTGWSRWEKTYFHTQKAYAFKVHGKCFPMKLQPGEHQLSLAYKKGGWEPDLDILVVTDDINPFLPQGWHEKQIIGE